MMLVERSWPFILAVRFAFLLVPTAGRELLFWV